MTILLLDALRGHRRTASLAPALEQRGYTVMREHTLRAALNCIRSRAPDLVIVDAVSLRTSGARICRQLRASLNSTPILLVADEQSAPDSGSGASATLVPPFTPRKLLHDVARLLPAKGESAYLQAGSIKLDLAQRRVISRGRQAYVTPKQAKLWEMFLRAPGQLLTRQAIIKHVWDTDYMGDTRTLDMHTLAPRSLAPALRAGAGQVCPATWDTPRGRPTEGPAPRCARRSAGVPPRPALRASGVAGETAGRGIRDAQRKCSIL